MLLLSSVEISKGKETGQKWLQGAWNAVNTRENCPPGAIKRGTGILKLKQLCVNSNISNSKVLQAKFNLSGNTEAGCFWSVPTNVSGHMSRS